MSEYIKREDAIDAMESINDGICEQQAIDALCELPSADLVEVIRCKDCKYFSQTTLGMDYACWHGADTVWGETGEHAGHNVCQRLESDNGYCSYGEKKDE